MQEARDSIFSQFDDPGRKLAGYEPDAPLRQHRKQMEEARQDIPFWLQAEQLAFGFSEDYDSDKGGWGTYYGPTYGFKNEAGQWCEAPSLAFVTVEVTTYWARRVREVKHPVLAAIYADLCWDLQAKATSTKPDISIAHIVIDRTVEAATQRLYEHETIGITRLGRALNIALCVKDQTRIIAVRDAILAYEDAVAEDQSAGLWGFSYDLIVDNKAVPSTPEITQRIVAGLEGRLGRLARPEGGGDPFAAEAAALRLAQYYRTVGKQDDVRRVLLAYGEHFGRLAEQAKGMVACAWLTKVHDNYVQYGLTEDAERLIVKLKEHGQKIESEMTPLSHSFTIPKEEWNAYIEEMTSDDLEQSLRRVTAHYLPSREAVIEQIKDLSRTAPLISLIRQSIIDENGREVASIGSVEDDLDGRVVHQMSQNMQFGQVFLAAVIDRIRQKYDLVPEQFVEFLIRSPAFTEETRGILIAGVSAYFAGDHLAAAHILIPQVESAIRTVVMLLGRPHMRRNRQGGFSLRVLDDLLRDDGLLKVLGPEIPEYLRVLLTDQRGWNLRNNVCHGMYTQESFGRSMTDRIIHALLVLAGLRKGPAPVQ